MSSELNEVLRCRLRADLHSRFGLHRILLSLPIRAWSQCCRCQITWARSRRRVEVAGRFPERRYGKRQDCVGWTHGLTGQPPRLRLSKLPTTSECTRGSEMPGAGLAVFHTAGAAGETDSTMRRCVPQPNAIAPARYHVSYCAWPAEARFGGRAKHGECTRRRRPGPLVNCPGDSAADHAALEATECHRARVKSGLNRDSSLRSV